MSSEQRRARSRSRRGGQNPQTSARIPPNCNVNVHADGQRQRSQGSSALKKITKIKEILMLC